MLIVQKQKKISLSSGSISSKRLTAYELFLDLLDTINHSISKVHIIKGRRLIVAKLIINGNQKKYSLDSNIIDVIILSLMTFSPLYVDPKLFSQDKLHFINEMKNNHKSIILNDKSKLRKLNDSLKELIKNEKFESAAVIRDRISYIKNKDKS